MSGDYSRFPFNQRRNYSRVLLQKGSVLLDQDWNEQSMIVGRSLRAALVDLVGRVFLATPGAFKIESDGRGELTIGRGRIYVDGLVAEKITAPGAPSGTPRSMSSTAQNLSLTHSNLICRSRLSCRAPADHIWSISTSGNAR